jgi:phosphatidylethanolamine-binding protein
MGPRPPVDIHRYMLVLFVQKTRVHAEAPGDRTNFKVRAFVVAHELGLPTACRRFDPGGSLDRRVNCRRVP